MCEMKSNSSEKEGSCRSLTVKRFCYPNSSWPGTCTRQPLFFFNDSRLKFRTRMARNSSCMSHIFHSIHTWLAAHGILFQENGLAQISMAPAHPPLASSSNNIILLSIHQNVVAATASCVAPKDIRQSYHTTPSRVACGICRHRH
jgi:hypothetical protein